jgi:hypothetical protein
MEPLPGAPQPETNRVRYNNSDGYDGIVEGGRSDWIDLRENEEDRDEYDPGTSGDCNWNGESAKVKGSLHEAFTVENAKEDRDT